MFSAVVVFQVFRPLKVLQKFRKNYIKNQHPGSLWKHERRRGGPPQGLQKGPWRGPTLGRAREPLGCPVAPLGAPFGPYFYPRGGNPDSRPLFSRSNSDLRRHRKQVSGDRIPMSAPCRDGEVPPDSSPSPLLPSSMKRE